MLRFNIVRALKSRGIDEPRRWLLRNCFVPQTVTTWLKYEIGYIKPDQMTRLCHLLNCTPNDLFEWHDDGRTVLHDTHALRSLIRPPTPTNVQAALRDLPLDKLEKVAEIIAELKTVE